MIDIGRVERVAVGERSDAQTVMPALADRLGERAHVAVVAVAAAVEHGLGDAGGLGALGEQPRRRAWCARALPACAARARTS